MNIPLPDHTSSRFLLFCVNKLTHRCIVRDYDCMKWIRVVK